MRGVLRAIVQKYNGERRQLLAMLRDVQVTYRCVPDEAITLLAEEVDVPRIQVEGTATFYHFLSHEHRGNVTVYLNTSVGAEMAGGAEVAAAFEHEVGTPFGTTSADRAIGLYTTSCIGMSDQEPAALINDIPFTRLTPARVRAIVAGIRAATPLPEMLGPLGDGRNASPAINAEVCNNIRHPGPVFFAPYTQGVALARALESSSLDIIESVKQSGLRGRGGAGFSTGQKWASCRATDGESRYVICNADEGEPGTFKDRVILTECAELMFEGMVIAGYAVEARRGLLYLRGEYAYLVPHLEQVLQDMRAKHLLGRRILGTPFSFDIGLRVGAGAYICGEESALIESAEGKRGTPRNRPPFPTVSGYRHRPTIVNNCETFGCAARIAEHGWEWFRQHGTAGSAGVKLLSVSGDCERPGVYEVPWGTSVREVLALCGAGETMAVQVGGPSRAYVPPDRFDRRLCYEDLDTGGAVTVIGAHRDLLAIVENHMQFFANESCGFCVPCRAGNTILLHAIQKIRAGLGTTADLAAIQQLGAMVKATSRCGLGQTSPNPLLSTIEHFRDVYLARVRADVDYVSAFDLEAATAPSLVVTGSAPLAGRG
ncbi:NAD(P)H-dependent oxidoreductase subunit E [Luteitalea sp.]|uniref:NAD(P)H-dependent oxidoreductase subunit E n=1 Tax=Luteitalea sp. TaxID=2004800 RepID=UPI0025C1838B|nr:NAD(P)H-dependent oxidoreductase subunit E [Luteitalea sp.]